MASSQTGTAGEAPAGRLERLRSQYSHLRDAEKEIALLIGQTEGEIERCQQRASQAAQRVRDLELNIDQYSRQEIGPVYEAAHGAELRTFVMKAQLEQLQAKRETLAAHVASLREFVAVLEDAGTQVSPTGSQMPAGAPSGRAVSMSIIQAQEKERQRLSLQMHDGPAQALTNLMLQAEICERMVAIDPDAARVELANLRGMVTATFQKVRDFSFDLRPMILDDLGLVPTLRKYVLGFQQKTGVAARLTISGKERRLPPPVEVGFFRSIQEALTNVAEHAKASHVEVSLDLADPAAVRATVEDDGQGFAVDAVLLGARERRTQGIAMIWDRLESLGGRAEFESKPGQGARVRLEAPVS
jgi:two-component system, NarL family, sensor histidine kinase DegS